jgi:hypothetical protein
MNHTVYRRRAPKDRELGEKYIFKPWQVVLGVGTIFLCIFMLVFGPALR